MFITSDSAGDEISNNQNVFGIDGNSTKKYAPFVEIENCENDLIDHQVAYF